MSKPWAFIAHKDGCWFGVASAELPRRELAKFLGKWAADGLSILTVNDRGEYEAALAKLKTPRQGAAA